MKAVHATIALILAVALFIFGCASSGMQSPPVCHTLCAPGQTQADYPACTCSGSAYTPVGGAPGTYCRTLCNAGQVQAAYPDCSCSGTGVGGPGGVGNGTGGLGNGTGGVPNLPPYNGSGGSGGAGGQGGFWGWNWSRGNIASGEDVLQTGGPAIATESQGMVLVLLGVNNAEDVPYDSVTLSIGAVSTYRTGSGGGWELLQGGAKNYSLKALNGRVVLVSRGRVGAGSQTRLLLELRNMTVTFNDTMQAVRAPKPMYIFVDLVPLRASGTSAVKVVLDLERTLTRADDGALYFTPTGEISSLLYVDYLVKDDGSVEIQDGENVLRESMAVDATGDSNYLVLDGIASGCMLGCTTACADFSSALCHAACASNCAGAPSETETTCFDGTRLNSCSAVNKPYYCGDDGDFTADCARCGCPAGQMSCGSDGFCVVPEVRNCGDGTLPNRCSPSKPGYCSGDGSIIPLCTVCGCPANTICQSGGNCG